MRAPDLHTTFSSPAAALASSRATAVLPVAAPAHRPARWRRPHVRAVGVGVIVTALLAYLALCSYMALTLTKPERVPFTKSPEQYGLAYENVSFPSRIDRLTLDGWYLPPAPAPATDAPTQKRPVVVVHGKASDRQQVTRDHNGVAIAAHLVRQGHPVLLFDLRGSGRSAGVRFTLGAQEVRDVGGAVDFLESRGLTPNGVSLLSFSMGAATSLLYTPTDLRVRSLVEDSAYGALGDVLDDQIPKASGLPRFFTPGVILMARPLIGVDAYSIRPIDAVRQLGQRRTPLMVIHGDADQTVPFRHGQEIAAAYAAASGGPTPETYWVPGAEHVGSYEVDPATYLARITAFLSR